MPVQCTAKASNQACRSGMMTQAVLQAFEAARQQAIHDVIPYAVCTTETGDYDAL